MTGCGRALPRSPPAIRLPRLEGERLTEIYLRLKLDEPLLFHVTGFKYRFDPRGDHIELIPEYLFDKGKIRTHRQAIDARLERLQRAAARKERA